jgi:CSLREA domain-containing protein
MEKSIERFPKIVKKPRRIYTITLILILLFLTWSPATGSAVDIPYIVNTTFDENDGKCDDGDCSLRDAIILANLNPGSKIEFNIDPSDSGCIGRFCTIKPTIALPALSGGNTTIDGFTQPTASSGQPRIEIDGSKAGIASGLDISSSFNLVRGLVINRFKNHGIKIQDPAHHNTISGNFIGTDLGGFEDLGNGVSGVDIYRSNHNTIGGSTEFERNVISGNVSSGIAIFDGTGNKVSGNYIGTDANGYTVLGNKDYGVFIGNSMDSIIGGNTENERNVISGNRCGIKINKSNRNLISGNYIGTDASGTAKLGNKKNGIEIGGGSQNNTIGGKTESEKNIISGNQHAGIFISDVNTDFNKVIGNNIGTDASGNSNLGNGTYGVNILIAKNNIIGPNNKIAYNGSIGVEVSGSDTYGNMITQNSIYSNGGKGIAIIEGANQGISAPVITSSSLGSVIIGGTACSKCTVELFQNSTNEGEGERYLGANIADYRGEFSINIESLDDLCLTATATDSEMGTSEFSQVFIVKKINIHLPLVLK